jgi:hypothetical protein
MALPFLCPQRRFCSSAFYHSLSFAFSTSLDRLLPSTPHQHLWDSLLYPIRREQNLLLLIMLYHPRESPVCPEAMRSQRRERGSKRFCRYPEHGLTPVALGTSSPLRSVSEAPGLVLRRQTSGAPQRDGTTAGPWAGDHAPLSWASLPRHRVDAHALQEEPRDS